MVSSNQQRAYQRAALEQSAASSLAGFVRVFWHVLEPGVHLEWNWHHDLICERLERVMDGEITDLVICIPPGCMKSLLASVFLPLYWWAYQPEKRIMCLSAVGAVTNRDAGKMLSVLRTPLYRRVVERVQRQQAKARGREWTEADSAKLWTLVRDGLGRITNSKAGERLSFTMHASFTGPRAHGFIVDDPYDVQEVLFGAPSRIAERMEEVRHIFSRKLSSRLNDKRPPVRAKVSGVVESVRMTSQGWKVRVGDVTHTAPRSRRVLVSEGDRVKRNDKLSTGGYFKIVIMQRLHPEDLAGWLMDKVANVEHLVLPTEYDPDSPYVCPDDPRTQPGELLHPALFTPEVIEKAKSEEELGLDQYEAQHNQQPRQIEGGMFGEHLFGADMRYTEEPWQLASSMDTVVLSVDCANKATETANYSAIGVWGKRGTLYYLLDMVHGRWEYDELEEAFLRTCRQWPTAHEKLIEDKGNGITLIQRAKKQVPGIIPVDPGRAIDPEHPLSRGKSRSKEDRAAFTKLALKAKQIRLPLAQHVPKVDRLITEHLRLGSGYKDDCVDMTSQVIEKWIVGDRGSAQSKRDRWRSRLAI